ncbi:MAG TPA: glycosyltransferase family 4 protein [Gemmataceae bacterium]|jgi:glycosyltransferase involved in cell wall biosynthesis
MRVAHFVQRYPPALGGSEDYFARLGRYLAAAGDHVTVFTTTAVDLPAFWSTSGRCLRAGRRIEDNVEIRRYYLWHIPYQTRVLKALSLVPYRPWQCLTVSCNPIAWRMWTESGQAREHFDLVHATAFPYGWPLTCARRLARRLGVPFLLTPFLHLGDPDDPRDRTRRAYTSPALLSLAQSADRLFVQTEGERQAFLDRGIPAERLILQGMGLDRDSCTGGDRRRGRAEWGIAEDDVVIGHLANNSREKGSVDLLRAAERAWRQGGRFVLVLAGPEMPNFQSFWRGHRPSGRVLRLGVLDARQKRDFFAAIDVFALPSRSDSFGLVLLEAWANGVPNIGYRAGGIGWVIHDEKDGLLVRCGDIQVLAAAILRLSVDAELRHRLGEAGLQRTRHEFEWTDKFEIVQRVYREITCERRQAALESA